MTVEEIKKATLNDLIRQGSFECSCGKIHSPGVAKVIIENDPARLRPVDVPIIEADISKIYKDTGWKPTISLPQTITDTLQYWRGHTLQ